MTLAWLQLSYRQTEAYSFSTETAIAFITAKNSRRFETLLVATEIADSSCKRQSPFTCARGLFTFRRSGPRLFTHALPSNRCFGAAALRNLKRFASYAKALSTHHENSLQTYHSVTR